MNADITLLEGIKVSLEQAIQDRSKVANLRAVFREMEYGYSLKEEHETSRYVHLKDHMALRKSWPELYELLERL